MRNAITETDDKPAIICFAGCDWWYHNRGLFCPQVMTRLAKHYKVLFVNSLGMRIPSLKKDRYAVRKTIRKLRSLAHFLRKTGDGMYVFSPVSLPSFRSSAGRAISTSIVLLQIRLMMILLSLREPICFVDCPPAFEIVKKLHCRYLVYQRTDIFEEMPGANRDYIASLDDVLSRTSDLVLYVNAALWQDGRKKNSNSLLIGHGVDFKSFANAEKSNRILEDMAMIRKPIIGFFGDITDDACDFKLIEHIAKTLPNMSLVFVGPISSDVSNLRAYKNIFFLGQKPYEQIPHYGKAFDVAIMPWKKNRWIEFCNPVKMKEYLALGKPIVSIDYPELKPYHDIVYASLSYDQFTDSICKAVEEHNPKLTLERQERVRNETWDSKVKRIMDFIEDALQHKNEAQ